MADDPTDARSSLSLIERLSEIEAAGSPGPWYVREVDDSRCMSAICVSTIQEKFFGQDLLGRGKWAQEGAVAGCLVQSELKAVHDDGRWSENALLIAEMRNNLPRLLELARIASLIA